MINGECVKGKEMSSYCHEHSSLHYRISNVYHDRCDRSGSLSLYIVLHFHGFEYHHGVTCGYCVAYFHGNRCYGTRQW